MPHRRTHLAAALMTLSAASITSVAAPALAQDGLVATYPAANTTYTTAPTFIRLHFTTPLRASGDSVEVDTPTGAQDHPTPSVEGVRLSMPFKATANGNYTIIWRATSAGGHPMNGKFTFTIKDAALANSTTSTANQQRQGSSAPTSAGANPSVYGPSSPTTNEPGDNHPALVIAGAALLTTAIGIGFLIARRRIKDEV